MASAAHVPASALAPAPGEVHAWQQPNELQRQTAWQRPNEMQAAVTEALCMWGTDDSYDRNLYPAGACATIGSGKPTGPNGTEVLFDETEDYETYRWVPLTPPPSTLMSFTAMSSTQPLARHDD